MHVARRLDSDDRLPLAHGLVEVGMGGACVVLGDTFLTRPRLHTIEQQPVADEADRRDGRGIRWDVDKLEAIMLAQEVEALAVYELRAAEDAFPAAPLLRRELLVHPDQLGPDEPLRLIEVSVLGKMGDERPITFDRQPDRLS